MGAKRPNLDLYLLTDQHATIPRHSGTSTYLDRSLDSHGFRHCRYDILAFRPSNSNTNAFNKPDRPIDKCFQLSQL